MNRRTAIVGLGGASDGRHGSARGDVDQRRVQRDHRSGGPRTRAGAQYSSRVAGIVDAAGGS